MHDDAATLIGTLRQQPNPLRDLIERAERLAALDDALRQWTQEPWFQSIRLANIRGDTVVLFASNAAALVPLRYRQQELLNFLRDSLKLSCTRLETKVRPSVNRRFTQV